MAALGAIGSLSILSSHLPPNTRTGSSVTGAVDGARERAFARTNYGGVAELPCMRIGSNVRSTADGARERMTGWARQVNGQTQINGVATNQNVTILRGGAPLRVYRSNPNIIVDDLPAGAYEVLVDGQGSKRSETWGPTSVSAPARLALSGSLSACSSGVAYSSGLTASGGYGTKTWDITGALPSGLSFNTSTGLITGTTSSTGTYKVTIGVAVPDGYRVFKDVTLTVA